MATAMEKIARKSFPKANLVTDRFHVQKLAIEALQEMRIAHRWEAINEETEAMEQAKFKNKKYKATKYINGNTPKQLLAISRYLLFKSANKWT